MQAYTKPLLEFEVSCKFASLKEDWIMRLHFRCSSSQLDWRSWSALVMLLRCASLARFSVGLIVTGMVLNSYMCNTFVI